MFPTFLKRFQRKKTPRRNCGDGGRRFPNGKETAPEDEFLTNTRWHIRNGNLRLALVDSVIGLEIVLARFLDSYLRVIKSVPDSRIRKFIKPDLGITARLAAILDLTLHESY